MKSKFKVSFDVEIEFDENEMTEQQAIEEITDSMYFPCEDTDNVAIVQQSVVEMPEEDLRCPTEDEKITEPQYRPFKLGETIEHGDQFLHSEDGEWYDSQTYIGTKVDIPTDLARHRKLIK